MSSRLSIPTPRGTVTVRPEADDGSDHDFLFRLFAAVREPEMAATGLDAAMRDGLLRMQFRSMAATYARTFPHARFEIVERDGARVGRIITDVAAERVEYVDIAMLPDVQGGGIATALMLALLEEPRRLGIPAQVKVLATNAASLRLCARVGFTQLAEVPPFLVLEWRGAGPSGCQGGR